MPYDLPLQQLDIQIIILSFFYSYLLHSVFSVNDDFAVDKISRKDTNVIERQGFVPPALGAPFIAATLSAAGAAAVGIYGAYGDELATLFNSFFSKPILDLFL